MNPQISHLGSGRKEVSIGTWTHVEEMQQRMQGSEARTVRESCRNRRQEWEAESAVAGGMWPAEGVEAHFKRQGKTMQKYSL